jgi:Holliday junction resolvase
MRRSLLFRYDACDVCGVADDEAVEVEVKVEVKVKVKVQHRGGSRLAVWTPHTGGRAEAKSTPTSIL